eukprot:403370055
MESLDKHEKGFLDLLKQFKSQNINDTDQSELIKSALNQNPQLKALFDNTSDQNQWELIQSYLTKNPQAFRRLLSMKSEKLLSFQLQASKDSSRNKQNQMEIKEENHTSDSSSFRTQSIDEYSSDDQSFQAELIEKEKRRMLLQSRSHSFSYQKAINKSQTLGVSKLKNLRQSSLSPTGGNRRKTKLQLTTEEIQSFQKKIQEKKIQMEQQKLLHQKMLHEAMAKVYIENLNYLHENAQNKFQTPIKIRLQHRKKENILNFVQDWSKVPLFSKVAHGKIKLSQEQKMLQEIEMFNKYIFMKGFEKTQLLRGLEMKLHDFIKYAKYELGMNDLQYHVNVNLTPRNVGAGQDSQHSRGQSLASIITLASKTVKENEQSRMQKIQEKDRKMSSWMIGSTIYDMCMDLMMCKKLFRFRTSMIQIFQKILEKDQQEQYYFYLQGEYEKTKQPFYLRQINDCLKRTIAFNQKLRNLIIYEYKPQAREFFTSHRFLFTSEENPSTKVEYTEKLQEDIVMWNEKQSHFSNYSQQS